MNYDFSSHQHSSRDKFNPYDTLDLPRDSDKNAIKQRFRMLTRVHHPDRNKNNAEYDPEHYARICSAYEILSDSRRRAAYDQQNASTWNSLRDQSQNFQVAPAKTKFKHNGKFGASDLNRFNDAFEKNRAADPNDRGYGDNMIGRSSGTSLEDIQRARSSETVDNPNLFGGAKNVSEGAFNKRFENEVKSRRGLGGGGRMMERNGDGPLAWNGNAGTGATGFSEVSIFDGMIVDQTVDDFTKSSLGDGLNYSDYMSGFDTFSEQLPEDHYYKNDNDIKKAYNDRVSQLTQIPERGHNRSYKEAEALMKKQQDDNWKRQTEINKQHVLKYRDQYTSEDLLPPSRQLQQPSQPQIQSQSRQSYDQPRQVQQVQQQQQGMNRPRPGNSGRRESQPTQPQPTQPQNPAMINNRMMNRMMDNVRSPRRF